MPDKKRGGAQALPKEYWAKRMVLAEKYEEKLSALSRAYRVKTKALDKDHQAKIRALDGAYGAGEEDATMTTTELERLKAINADLLAALKPLEKKIAREIERGGGLFSDAEYEAVRAAVAKAKEAA